MLPIPTRAAQILFVQAFVGLLFGVMFDTALVVTLSLTTLLLLILAAIFTLPMGRRLRAQGLQFAWWLEHGDDFSGLVPESPCVIHGSMRHTGPTNLVLDSWSPISHGHHKHQDIFACDTTGAVHIAAQGRTDFTFEVRPKAMGRLVFHGLAAELRGALGLFYVPLYFANPIVLQVLPSASLRKLRRSSRPRAVIQTQHVDHARLRRRGAGTDFYELRELQPGDPFRAIAWKASARRGKLMVREVEQGIQQTHLWVLDISESTRSGSPGARVLDRAIEHITAHMQAVFDTGDRVGLTTVDTRMYSWVPPSDRAEQKLRIYNALLATLEVVDQDLTYLTDDELADFVDRYARHQDGKRLTHTQQTEAGRLQAMVQYARQQLDPADWEPLVNADTEAGRVLRTFCRSRGFALPHTSPVTHKRAVFARVLTHVLKAERQPMTVHIVTDAQGWQHTHQETHQSNPSQEHTYSLKEVLFWATKRGHQLHAWIVATEEHTADKATKLESALHKVYTHQAQRSLEDMQTMFSQYGVTVGTLRKNHPSHPRTDHAASL